MIGALKKIERQQGRKEKNMENNFQPNFVAYAIAHGKEPQQMIDFDSKKYPGGCMTGFILWISEMKTYFYSCHPECFLDYNIIKIDLWVKFLQDRAKEESNKKNYEKGLIS